MRHKIAIQMDDIKTIDYTFDSSFMIGLEGQKRNFEISLLALVQVICTFGLLMLAPAFLIELNQYNIDTEGNATMIKIPFINPDGNGYNVWVVLLMTLTLG